MQLPADLLCVLCLICLLCCSDIFLGEAVRLMRERGYAIGNIDCTIIAQVGGLNDWASECLETAGRCLPT